ncbi:hypothetical protein VNO77_37136 [Canavalia gladiata]|uniref:ATP-dependent DNA helicase n=1 Tax=Canavalia gladiata TaxID=3824 RepID=A0AAN9KAS9_CANGL
MSPSTPLTNNWVENDLSSKKHRKVCNVHQILSSMQNLSQTDESAQRRPHPGMEHQDIHHGPETDGGKDLTSLYPHHLNPTNTVSTSKTIASSLAHHELDTLHNYFNAHDDHSSSLAQCESHPGYFDINEQTDDPHIHKDHGTMSAEKQSHTGYWDIGDQNHECHYCHAIMWYSERLNKRSHTDNPRFRLCCNQGKVKLPYLKNAPPTLLRLLRNDTDQSRFFRQNIKSFNMMFSFTSMGGQIQREVNDGNGPPMFVLCGENYHRIGSLLPLPMEAPKFSQFYIYDTDNEVANKMMAVRMINDEKLQTSAIVQDIKHMLDQCNPYVKVYRMTRDRLKGCDLPNMKLRIIGKRVKDGRRYNLPTTSEVAALIVGDLDSSDGDRDVIIETQTGLRLEDRPNLLCRVFKIKLDHLIMEIKDDNVFGKVVSVVYTIEFQKRGLPHAHILVFLHPANKFVTADDIDRIICAEIPDYKQDRELFNIVQTLMTRQWPQNKERYLSSCEVAWRTFAFDIHHREPAVERLSFHLPEEQYIIFEDDDSLQQFVWKQTLHEWTRRKRGFSIGRLHFVPPGSGELYYLRFLLNKVRGPQSYADIRIVNNITYRTFKEACYTIGLLDDDREYIDAINQANDIVYNQRRALQQPALVIPEQQIEILALFEIHKLLQSHNKSLSDYPTMPQPNISTINHSNNVLILDELQYDREQLAKEHDIYLSTMTVEQHSIYSKIMHAISIGEGKLFFLYGYGGTGKTFLWKTISTGIRSKGDIVLTVASSGIAALLLPGGRTAHSRFNIPINIHEDSICNIKQGSQLAELIVIAKLIIWDEAPMAHKHCFEAVDKTFKDILRFSNPHSSHKPFGGKVIVFCGDFRQILPVIPKGSRQDVVHATINSSYLWKFCEVLTLTKNMRLQGQCTNYQENDLNAFSKWILAIGEGTIGDEIDDTLELHIPDEFLIHECVDPVASIVQETYPDFINNANIADYFHNRAILAPTNDIVKKVNDYMLHLMPGESRTYISSDQPSNMNEHSVQQNDIHTSEFLNTINCSGLPNHEIKLKVGAPIILLRNIDHTAGMCNGSRMVITRMGNYILQAKVISGNNVGQHIFIPRLSLTPSDHRIPFKFQRRQFPIALSFAMTINKSQGQALRNVGIYIPKSLFSHGQLYVAVSRVTHKDGLRLLITDETGHLQNTISNVVYKEVFHNHSKTATYSYPLLHKQINALPLDIPQHHSCKQILQPETQGTPTITSFTNTTITESVLMDPTQPSSQQDPTHSSTQQVRKCSSFWMQYDPDEVLESLPTLFVKSYKDDIPNIIKFHDPAETEIMFDVIKTARSIVINGGWEEMKDIYPKLKHGGWLHLKYTGNGNFFLRVYNLKHNEIKYSKEPRSFLSDTMKFNKIIADFRAESMYSSGTLPYDYTCRKTLTKHQLLHKLALPITFTRAALPHMPRNVYMDCDNVASMSIGMLWT